jgi:hypothetical protein
MGIIRAVGLGVMFAAVADGRCAMCWRTAQSLGLARGRVLNLGILIMALPPLLILVGAVIFVRRRDRGGDS